MLRLLLPLVLLALAACTQPTGQAPRPSGEVTTSEGIRHFRGELVVGYETEAHLEALKARLGARELGRIPELRAALLALPPGQDAVRTARGLWEAPPEGLRYAEPHGAWILAPIEDPVVQARRGGELVALGNPSDQIFDQLPQYALDPRHLDARAAWDRGFTGRGVKVAIIDDATDVVHPDLAARWAGRAYDPVTDTVYTTAADWMGFIGGNPNIYHGTFVTGTISSPKDGQGIVGLAHEATFLPVAIFQPGFVGLFPAARGIVWSVNEGAHVLNNSWGGLGYSHLLKEAFDYALEAGRVVVASAGNSYKDEIRYPAGYPGIIASAAAQAGRRPAAFTTMGRHISSAAPGVDVLLPNPTWAGGGYGLISGTSFSGPYTAAAAALVKQACPGATPYQVRRALETTTWSYPDFNRVQGFGHLNAGRLAGLLARGCAALPPPGGVAQVVVEYQTPGGRVPGTLADVILRSRSLQPGNPNDPSPVYWARTDFRGEAWFLEIAPGEYDLYVAGADLVLTGHAPEERGTFVGTLTVRSGSTAGSPDRIRVVLNARPPAP